jgi:hypothetical protein
MSVKRALPAVPEEVLRRQREEFEVGESKDKSLRGVRGDLV